MYSTRVKYRTTGTMLIKTKLAPPTMVRKSAASPNLALPRTILKRTWQEGKELLMNAHNVTSCGAALRMTFSKYKLLCRTALENK